MILRISKAQRLVLYMLLCLLTLPMMANSQEIIPEITAAQQAIARAEQADAHQYAHEFLTSAQETLSQAQHALMQRRERKNAPILALRAAADADLARSLSEKAVVSAQLQQLQAEVEKLEQSLATQESGL